jgi:hypothetical protein
MIAQKIGRNAVLKLTFCLRRLPKLSLAEFQEYWLHKHGPLVKSLQPALGMVRYVQTHRLAGDLDEETFRAARRNPEAREAGRLLLEDEAKFIDLPRSPLWLNREQVVYGAGEPV